MRLDESYRVPTTDNRNRLAEPAVMLATMPVSKNRKKKKNSSSPGPARPAPKRKPPSPRWYVITMFAAMGVGVLLVILNYVFALFGGWGLWVGLASLAAGFLMTTNYR